MSPPRFKDKKDKADTRQLILDAARELYLSEGLAGVSMRKVAERVRVAPGALYWHFPNKEELVAAIFLEGVTAFDSRLAAADQGPTARIRLERLADAFLAFGLDEPRQFEVFFLNRPPSDVGGDAWRAFEKTRAEAFLRLVNLVRGCQEEGAFRSERPRDQALLVLSTCIGLVTLYLVGQLAGERAHFESLFRERITALFNQFAPAPPR